MHVCPAGRWLVVGGELRPRVIGGAWCSYIIPPAPLPHQITSTLEQMKVSLDSLLACNYMNLMYTTLNRGGGENEK